MNLDFTMLSGLPAQQPVRKPWGQAGTPGTPLLTTACVLPGGGDKPGTAGDKCLTPPADSAELAAAGGFCPPVSPPRPQCTEGRSPNEINVYPLSPLVPGLEGQGESGGDFDHDDSEERAAIMDFDGGITRSEAEAAARILIGNARRKHAHD